jgi:poly(3-hydroxybutyrate) depolymerase
VDKECDAMSKLGYYDLGATPMAACQFDQRFPYCLYVPRGHRQGTEGTHLVVVVHGTNRTAERYRDEFAQFAEEQNCIILAPLFPAGIVEAGDLENYKYIEYHGIRFDQILLAMVDEVAQKYRVDTSRFLLHGFSGGGHFAHRFYYLHATRLLAVSIGAPGMITLLDADQPWYLGTRDLKERFGTASTLPQMRAVPVHMVVGAEDTETWEINDTTSPRWMAGADATGPTRVERLKALRSSYESHGIAVGFDVLSGVAHEGYKVLEPVRDFFASVLAAHHEIRHNSPTHH